MREGSTTEQRERNRGDHPNQDKCEHVTILSWPTGTVNHPLGAHPYHLRYSNQATVHPRVTTTRAAAFRLPAS